MLERSQRERDNAAGAAIVWAFVAGVTFAATLYEFFGGGQWWQVLLCIAAWLASSKACFSADLRARP